ncbi:MAG: DNA-processing protein DprA [Arcobacteraceae bacterium]
MIEAVNFHINALNSMSKYPKELFYKGNIELLERKIISIVGTRNPFYNTQMATQRLSHTLSQAGICIASGGALGVDSIAHRAAGVHNTIMVSPSGLEVFYPATNRQLIQNIQESGLAISAYANDFKATPWSFVARNEIVVALGDVLVVAQADLKSGSLRSVEFALKMGKPIYVLPHRLGESQGTNELLQKGLAKAIYDIDEFVNIFAVTNKKIKPKTEKNDEFLEYCKSNPKYDDAVSKYSSKVFEYELGGKIVVKNGMVSLPTL